MEYYYRKNLKRNFLANVAEGAVTTFAMGMVPLTTVLTYFVSQFVTQKWVIGLLPCLFNFLVFCPQVLLSRKIESLRYYKHFTIFMAFLHRFPWLLMALNVYLFAESNPQLFIVIFYILYSFIGLTLGFGGLTTLCLISRVIPDNSRGRLLGTKATVGGIFELLGSFVMGIVLKSQGYPVNYALLFLVVFASSSLSMVFLSMIREKEPEACPAVPDKGGYGRYIKKMFHILKNDVPYVYFIISIILVSGFGKMPFAFHTVYAKDRIGITEQDVLYATIVLLASQTLGYMVWGYVGDKLGHRLPLIISTVTFIPAILLTYLMANQYIFFLSIFFLGVSQSAFNVNMNNLSIDLCSDRSSLPTYVGLRCLITGPFIAFASLLGGVIIDYFGYTAMFALSLVFVLAGLYTLVAKLKVGKNGPSVPGEYA